MKHIKIYEDFDTYSIQDFLDIPYWRYKNRYIDCIMHVDFLDTDEHKWNSEYKYTILNNNAFLELVYKQEFLLNIIKLQEPEKILRPATEDEIKEFEFQKDMKKFNI